MVMISSHLFLIIIPGTIIPLLRTCNGVSGTVSNAIPLALACAPLIVFDVAVLSIAITPTADGPSSSSSPKIKSSFSIIDPLILCVLLMVDFSFPTSRND